MRLKPLFLRVAAEQFAGERRLITLGEIAGRVVVIVHTPREEATRIISMRKANERERQIYQKRRAAH